MKETVQFVGTCLRHYNRSALHFSKKSLNKVILICIDVSYLLRMHYSRLMYCNYTNIHIRTVQKFMTVDKEERSHLLNLLTYSLTSLRSTSYDQLYNSQRYKLYFFVH